MKNPYNMHVKRANVALLSYYKKIHMPMHYLHRMSMDCPRLSLSPSCVCRYNITLYNIQAHIFDGWMSSSPPCVCRRYATSKPAPSACSNKRTACLVSLLAHSSAQWVLIFQRFQLKALIREAGMDPEAPLCEGPRGSGSRDLGPRLLPPWVTDLRGSSG
jgi:hypothetical protein